MYIYINIFICVYALNPQCFMIIHRQVDLTGTTQTCALQEPWPSPGQVFGQLDPSVVGALDSVFR